jgi:uncharacterized protein VcgC/VcgE DUF2780
VYDRGILKPISRGTTSDRKDGRIMRSKTQPPHLKCAAVLFCALFILAAAQAQAPVAPPTTSSSGLVSQLTQGLSITRPQARGGAGALFALAKTRLTTDEFSKVSSAVPGMSSLLKAAPVPSENSGLSSLESALPGNMGRMAEVAEAFHKLGLSPEMAGKFLPVMSKYVEARGGSSTASLLEKALK